MLNNKLILPSLFFLFFIFACSDNNTTSQNNKTNTTSMQNNDISSENDYDIVNIDEYTDKQPELLEFFWYG